MRGTDRCTGVTLAEVLVVTGLSALLLGTVAAALKLVFATYRKGDREVPAFRRSVDAVAFLAGDLATCEALYAPEPARLYVGVQLGEVPVVWARRDGAGRPVLVGYVRDVGRDRLARRVYAGEQAPEALAAPLQSSPLPVAAEEVKLLYVPDSEPYLDLYAPAPGDEDVWTRVNPRGAYGWMETEGGG